MQWSEEERAAIKDELARLLVTAFKRKPSLTDLLTYIVEKNLEGHIPTEEEIYQDILRALFDPAKPKTSKVRTEAHELRGDLKEHYARTHEGRVSPVAIFIAPKGYALSVDFRAPLDAQQLVSTSSTSSPLTSKRKFVMIVKGANYKDLARLYRLIIDFLADNTDGEATAILSFREKASLLVEIESSARIYHQLRQAADTDALPLIGPFVVSAVLDFEEALNTPALISRSYRKCFVPIPALKTVNSISFQFSDDDLAAYFRVQLICFRDLEPEPASIYCPLEQSEVSTVLISHIDIVSREFDSVFVELSFARPIGNMFTEMIPSEESPIIIVGTSPVNVQQIAAKKRRLA